MQHAMTLRQSHYINTFEVLKSTVRHRANILRNDAVFAGRNVYPYLNVLFVHIPKTAGTSMHATLAAADAAAASDGAVANADLQKLLRTRPGNHHMKASEWRTILGSAAFAGCTKVTVVRNPWDLMVSSFEWWRQKAPRFPPLAGLAARVQEMSFSSFLRSPLGARYVNEWPGEMVAWYQSDASDIVDRIFMFEDLEHSVRGFLSERGLADATIPRMGKVNSTVRRMYRSYYQQNDAELVGRRFLCDVERFGYSF